MTHVTLRFQIFSILLLAIIVAACDPTHDPRLQRAESLMEQHPDSALAILSALSDSGLSEADRHLHTLLKIKAEDKTFKKHTSDSLINPMVKYYESHGDKARYAEALYLAGSVHSDMGDYPRALENYYKALTLLPDNGQNLHLRGCLVSDIAWTLIQVRVYSRATEYLREVIRIDSIEGNTLNLIYDTQMLGANLTRLDSLDQAESVLKEILKLEMPEDTRTHVRTFIAEVLEKKGDIQQALEYVRGTPETAHPIHRNVSLAFATSIYYKAGILDTAYMYARDLAFNGDETNRRKGFRIMLSPGIRERLHPDTMLSYVIRYNDELNNYLDLHDKFQISTQESRFNYGLHDRDKKIAEEDSRKKSVIISVFIAIVCLLVATILVVRYYHTRQTLKLIAQLEKLKVIRDSYPALLERSNEDSEPTPSDSVPNNDSTDSCQNGNAPLQSAVNDAVDMTRGKVLAPDGSIRGNNDLRVAIQEELTAIISSEKTSLHPDILSSSAHSELQEYIKNRNTLKDDDPLWKSMEETVTRSFPNFINNLRILLGDKFKEQPLHTALLIKFGVRSTDMECLLSLSKGGVSKRKESLGKLMFDRSIGNRDVESIIRAL